MAQIMPREDLQRYADDGEAKELVDYVEDLVEQHEAGWTVNVGALEPWAARLFVFWRNMAKTFDRQEQRAAKQLHEQLLKAILKLK
jgi:hypothetical protein